MKILNQSKTVQRIHAKMHVQKLEMELQKRRSENIEGEINVNGNQAVLLENRLKGRFFTKNIVNLSKWNLNDVEISLLLKRLNFVSTCNNRYKAKVKIELEAFGRMLCLK